MTEAPEIERVVTRGTSPLRWVCQPLASYFMLASQAAVMSSDPPRLPDIVYTVDDQTQTVSVFNFEAADRVGDTLREYFANQSVRLRRGQTDDRIPKNFVVLHDGAEFLAASPLERVYEAIRTDAAVGGTTNPATISQPDVLAEITHTEFTSYNKARMVNVSRIIEQRAWKATDGELHTGFQRLSRARDQWHLYSQLAAGDLDVHVYGAPDWDVPPTEATIHGYDEAEITRTWFVIADTPDEASRCALLAEERGPDEFYGFWTDETQIIDTILERLRQEYPPTTAGT